MEAHFCHGINKTILRIVRLELQAINSLHLTILSICVHQKIKKSEFWVYISLNSEFYNCKLKPELQANGEKSQNCEKKSEFQVFVSQLCVFASAI